MEQLNKAAPPPVPTVKYRLIPEPLLEAVIEYLMTRPFKEVGKAVPQLMALEQLVMTPPTKDAKKAK